jgi:uncharacterized protein (TIGR03437 family)
MKLLFLLAAALPAFAQCTYTFTPSASQSISVPAPASTTPNTIAIAVASGCNWIYSTDSSWITFPGITTAFGSGSGSISWNVSQNVGPGGRTGHITVGTNNGGSTVFTVLQLAPICTLTLNPSSVSVPLGGAAGSFAIQTNCTWQVTGASSFIGLTSYPAGSLNGTQSYAVVANTCVPALTGAIAVQAGGAAGPTATFQVNQAGSQSNLTLSPTTLNAPATAATGTVALTTGSGCSWSAYSDVSWMSITNSASGSGSANLKYSILANTNAARTGSIHVGSALFTVTQAAVTAPAVTLAAVGNAADYAQGPVSPGEVVVLAGSNLGPAQSAKYTVANGFLPTILGGAQVFFGTTPAPLLYVSAAQVNAVVPYEVSGSTQVTVSYGGAVSTALTLQVAPTTPGILTLDASGFGGGAILNQDLSVNTPSNPAALGSVVVIYCIGGGVTNPPSVDGQVFGATAPVLTQSVTVNIGGLNAQVAYSGAVPWSIAGLTQINAYVPTGLTTSGQLPIFVNIGGVQSQNGVTVAIQ